MSSIKQLEPTEIAGEVDTFDTAWCWLVEHSPISEQDKAMLLEKQRQALAEREQRRKQREAHSAAIVRDVEAGYQRMLAERGKKRRTRPAIVPTERLYVTVPEAAAMLSMSRASVYRLMDDNRLPSAKVGGMRRIRRCDLDWFMEQQ